MQTVQAKCIMDAWDSVLCVSYKPGQGPLPGGLYEIDRHGPLSQLKTPRGNPVFEFDRNAGPDDKPHDYSCKLCGATKDAKGVKFTLNTLGTHTREAHKVGERESSEDVQVAKDGRGKKTGKTFTCKEPGCGEVFPNLYAYAQHKKTHKAAVEQAA